MGNKILQANPGAGYQAYKTEIDNAVKEVLESGWYILGKSVEEFEKKFASYNGKKYCVGVANGTDAIVLSLKAMGIGLGDAVFTVSHTAVATVAAIELAGATPVLVDLDPVSYTMSPERLGQAIAHTKKTLPGLLPKAVVPVHIFGHPCDMEAVCKVASEHGLEVLEDCAQAHGASINGVKVSAWGRASAFSFYPTKNLGAIGDGGGIVTDDEHLYKKIKALQQYGWVERYISSIPGENSRLDEIQAAILSVKLNGLDSDNAKRNAIAKIYGERLQGLPIVLPQIAEARYRSCVSSVCRKA